MTGGFFQLSSYIHLGQIQPGVELQAVAYFTTSVPVSRHGFIWVWRVQLRQAGVVQ
jgi:hypothetical protein